MKDRIPAWLACAIGLFAAGDAKWLRPATLFRPADPDLDISITFVASAEKCDDEFPVGRLSNRRGVTALEGSLFVDKFAKHLSVRLRLIGMQVGHR
jgi:hypothetical protein